MLAVVDTGPLYAAVDADDADHAACVKVLEEGGFKLVIPALVVAETTYLVGSRLGAQVEASFLRGLGSMDVDAPPSTDWGRIAELVERYADLSIGGTDASVVATAERLRTDVIVTLDRRHFSVIRFKNGRAPRLFP